MPRPILDETCIHPAIRERVANHEGAIVQDVQSAIAQHSVVVVPAARWMRPASPTSTSSTAAT